jgi:uncharacterized protein YjbJ (UPF0337 family)
MTNTNDLAKNWLTIKSKLKKKFASLNSSDLILLEGRQEEMIQKLQKRLGKTREELNKLIAEL